MMSQDQIQKWINKKRKRVQFLLKRKRYVGNITQLIHLAETGQWSPDEPLPTKDVLRRAKRNAPIIQAEKELNPQVYKCLYCNYETTVLSLGLRVKCPKCLKRGFLQYFPDLVKLLLDHEPENSSN